MTGDQQDWPSWLKAADDHANPALLTDESLLRLSAVRAARDVLGECRGGPLTKGVSLGDYIVLAEWILQGSPASGGDNLAPTDRVE